MNERKRHLSVWYDSTARKGLTIAFAVGLVLGLVVGLVLGYLAS